MDRGAVGNARAYRPELSFKGDGFVDLIWKGDLRWRHRGGQQDSDGAGGLKFP